MALRQWRSPARHLGVYMTSITVGVASLVALHSFRDDVARSIASQNRTLLGSDLRISGDRPAPAAVGGIVDSLVAEGATVARVVGTLSMALAEQSGRTRLVQLRGVEPGFPFYGEVITDPPGQWSLISGRRALVDPGALAQLGIEAGDTMVLAGVRFAVVGTVGGLPTDIGLQVATGPRVFLARDQLEATGLLGRGSLSRHHLYLRIQDGDRAASVMRERYGDVFRSTGFTLRSAEQHARTLTGAADTIAEYVGLMGLAALILGGVGVGSAVHVFVQGRATDVAVLRCLGATRRQVFHVYLLQAAGMGVLGSLGGVVLGLVIQRFLPLLVRDVLPVELRTHVSLGSIAVGFAVGVVIAFLFALLPMLSLRRIPPLGALRQVARISGERDPMRPLVIGGIASAVVLLAVAEAPNAWTGLILAGGLTVVALGLWVVAIALTWASRRLVPHRLPFPVRQGVRNLFRPGNQTVTVTLALGFGVLVVGVILQLRANLIRELTLIEGVGGPNVLVFDVQPDQEPGVGSLVSRYAEAPPASAPLVTARIHALGDRTAADLLADTGRSEGPERWTLGRQYRNTYRAQLKESEAVVAGRWWDPGVSRGEDGLPRISVEAGLAASLQLSLGDVVTWSVAGNLLRTRVANLRQVDWGDFDANFFVVFEPGVLETLPQSHIMLARVTTSQLRAELQEVLVRRYPNVSVLDLNTVRMAIESVLSRLAAAVRILAALAVATGVLVMLGSVVAAQDQRRREGVLLRTLGARGGQVQGALVSEYVALGTLASLAGGALALPASWVLTVSLLELRYVPAVGSALVLWGGVVGMVVLAGVASVGWRSTAGGPLRVLRALAE